jgi:hypothetical protein
MTLENGTFFLIFSLTKCIMAHVKIVARLQRNLVLNTVQNMERHLQNTRILSISPKIIQQF